MHEAGLLAVAVAEALAAGPPPAVPAGHVPALSGSGDPGAPGFSGGAPGASGGLRPIAMIVRVHDPMHVTPESAALHAEIALRERGLSAVPITVVADPVACAVCEAPNEVRAEHPFCTECGFPLPDRGGHAVEVILDWGGSTTGGSA